MKQSGFTLIELMIALILGLIVTASATLLFLSGQRNLVLQHNVNRLQDDQSIGLSYITSHIRLANLNNNVSIIKPGIAKAGIVFNKDNFPVGVEVKAEFDDQYSSLTTNNSSNFTGSADLKNDQLVIQYRPAEVGGVDCAGGKIESRRHFVVERYFIRTDLSASLHETDPQEKQVLACAAGRYSISEDIESMSLGSSFYGNGEIIIKRVDLFKVRFLVEEKEDKEDKEDKENKKYKKYINLEDYKKLTNYPRILSVQLAVISRAAEPNNDPSIPLSPKFHLWTDFDVTLKPRQTRRYLRTPLIQTVALRNALGDR